MSRRSVYTKVSPDRLIIIVAPSATVLATTEGRGERVLLQKRLCPLTIFINYLQMLIKAFYNFEFLDSTLIKKA